MVALMINALELKRTDKVLEIGTGSGYQAAILGELSDRVVSIERLPSLARSAKKRLASLGYNNVEIRCAEKTLGWKLGGPYDAIIVAAGAPKIPHEIIEQLSIGGRLIVPVGSMTIQELMKITKTKEGYITKTLGSCRFVPLLGIGAWPIPAKL